MQPSPETGTATETDHPHKRPLVTLYVRTPADFGTHGRQRDVLSILDRLHRAGHLAGYEVETWGRSVVLDRAGSSDRAGDVIEAVEAFREWAASNDRTLEPAFRERRVPELGVEGGRTHVTLPVMCLAVVEDEGVVGVFPSADAETDRVDTVFDALDAFERDEEPWPGRADRRPVTLG